MSHKAAIIISLLDEAFRVLQHDSDEGKPEYAHLHSVLGKSFRRVLKDVPMGQSESLVAAQSGEPVALDIHERNALNEAVKLLPSISALRTLRAKLLAAPQPSQPVEAGEQMTNGDFHCPACGEVMKGPTACGSCLWEADTCGYKPAVVLDEQTNALEACRAIVKWCDENPPAGEALWCVQLARRAIAAQSAPAAKAGEPTYASSQATNCAQCGEHKHTPLRIDWMGGYVCLTCIDKELEALDPAVVLDDERATFEAEWWKTIWYGDDAMRQIGWWAWQARAASPQATVYSLFSSSDRRNFGHLAPQEFVNAVIDAVRAQATATQPCIAPGCYQWDGTDSCTCQKATAMQPAQTERALTCDSRKRGEYDWLRCCSPRDHTGEHCYVTDYDAQPASGVDHE